MGVRVGERERRRTIEIIILSIVWLVVEHEHRIMFRILR